MAERYVSALTGPEMDAALLDMAQHNSEAWAVGTRNGTAVSSSDDTYQNNSKYYADEAEAAAARAEAAVPAGTEGAVLFSQAQSLTDAQKVQARANISAGQGGTNPNLLDNPWFTVNQRQVTSGTVTALTRIVDRWIVQNSTYAYNETTHSIEVQASVDGYGLAQEIPRQRIESGRTYTVSAEIGGAIGTLTFVMPSSSGYVGWISGAGVRVYWVVTSTNARLWFVPDVGVAKTFTRVKLELGNVSTLANDAPPDYVEELLKCQHYFYASRIRANVSSARIMLAFGWVASTDGKTVCLFVPTPVPMRNVPQNGASLASGGFSFLNPLTGAYLTYQTGGLTVLGQTQAGVTIQTGANAAITTPFVVAYTGGGGGINLSADL